MPADDPDERGRLAVARYEVVARVAHDLRTPLNTVLLACDALAAATTPEERARHLATIRRAGMRAEQHLAELAELAAVEHGAVRLDRRAVELRGALAEAVRAHAGAVVVDEGFPAGLEVQADRARLVQGVGAALAYAARTSDGTMQVATRHDDAVAELAVTWQIAATARLADDDPWGPGARGGAGALALARALVAAHGGAVVVERPAETTLRLVVTLPRR